MRCLFALVLLLFLANLGSAQCVVYYTPWQQVYSVQPPVYFVQQSPPQPVLQAGRVVVLQPPGAVLICDDTNMGKKDQPHGS